MPPSVELSRDMRGQLPLDGVIAEVADRQHGVITYRQLLELGLGADAVHHRARTGRLYRVHRGVYAVGRRRIRGKARWMAGVLAYAPDGVLSHRCAASLHGLLSYSGRRIDVTTTGGKKRSGIVVHRVKHLPDEDRVLIDGIPVTSVARTIIDLSRVVRTDQLERMIDAADKRGVFDLAAFEGRAIPPGLSDALRAYYDLGFTRSELERFLVRLCRAEGFDRPAMNIWIGDQEVDAVWEEHKVVVLIDSWEHHHTRAAFEDDRRRQAALQRRGYRVLPVTDRRLVHGRHRFVADLGALIPRARPAAPGGGSMCSSRAS